MSRVLPPGVDGKHFDKAVAALRRELGAQWVITEESAGLAEYRDTFAILDAEHCAPSAAVRPGSVEDVQKVMRIAGEYGVPLSPISRGKNLGFGGASPRLSGAVVLDLSRMNRIIEVDETFGYALVEPGVSFIELAEHLRENDSDFWLDVPDLAWGSVLGNTLERGVGYTPYGDHLAIQCGMEIVLPDGDVVRTGTGALPGSRTAQLAKYGYGPQYDPMFTQSNFGVVTKMGVWLFPKPAGHRGYMITLPREEDLGPFVEILRPLRLNQTVPHGPTLRSLLLDASAHGPRSAYYTGEGPIPEHVCRQIQDELKIGRWNFYGMLYGTPAAMDAQWEVIREAFSAIPGARFYFEGEHDNPVLAIRSKIMSARPSLEATSTFQWIDNAGHVNFALSSPATGADALKQYRMARDRAHEAGKDYMGTFIVGLRDMQHVNPMMFDTLDRQDRTRTHELCVRLLRDAAAEGYGAYRTHPSLMDQVAATYSHNGNSLLRLSEKIKDALDPAGILAPGKQGIWPARFRGSDQPALIDRVPLTDEAVEWLGRVEGIAPVIEKFRDDAERDRHLSWQVFEALRGAGIHRMLISRKFGGSHVDLRTGSAVLQALAKLDPSVAWVMAVQAAVGRLSDYLAKPIARKIFKDQSSLVVGSVNPSGRAEVAAGGYRLSGTWAFASGSADADWLVCAAIVTEGGKPRGASGPEIRMLCVPKSEVRMLDTWYTLGLRGTGSEHYEIEDLFVSEEFTVDGAILHRPPADRPSLGYAISYYDFGLFGSASTTLGIARGALESFKALALAKTPAGATSTLAGNHTVQEKLARAEMLVRSARVLLSDAAWHATEHGTDGGESLSATLRLTAATVAENSAAAVDILFNLAGTSSVYSNHLLERYFRDVHSAAKHITVSPSNIEMAGQYLLGGPLQLRR